MSWPSDGLPRYIASPAISGERPGDFRALPEAYVYDRAQCHAIVYTARAYTKHGAERAACAMALRLNAE